MHAKYMTTKPDASVMILIAVVILRTLSLTLRKACLRRP